MMAGSRFLRIFRITAAKFRRISVAVMKVGLFAVCLVISTPDWLPLGMA
jgi:hypothetical protein